jgi:hypothetical protein
MEKLNTKLVMGLPQGMQIVPTVAEVFSSGDASYFSSSLLK